MTLIAMEGFDHMDTRADLLAKGWGAYTSGTAPNGVGRFSEGRALLNTSSSAWALQTLPSALSTIYYGVAVKHYSPGTPTYATQYPFMIFKDENGVNQVKLHVNAGWGLNVRTGAAIVIGDSDDNLFVEDEWGYLEIKIVVHATAGEVTIKMNGVEVFSDTACDTKNGTDYIKQIHYGIAYSNLGFYFDDMYADDAEHHGNVHIKTFTPDADGTHSDLTRNTGAADYECVDEILPNRDTDYVAGATVGNKSTFGITTGALETIKGIQVNNMLRITSAGARTVKQLVRSNSVDYQGAESAGLVDDYRFEKGLWITDPDDSNVWTQTKLEAAEFGVEIIS